MLDSVQRQLLRLLISMIFSSILVNNLIVQSLFETHTTPPSAPHHIPRHPPQQDRGQLLYHLPLLQMQVQYSYLNVDLRCMDSSYIKIYKDLPTQKINYNSTGAYKVNQKFGLIYGCYFYLLLLPSCPLIIQSMDYLVNYH